MGASLPSGVALATAIEVSTTSICHSSAGFLRLGKPGTTLGLELGAEPVHAPDTGSITESPRRRGLSRDPLRVDSLRGVSCGDLVVDSVSGLNEPPSSIETDRRPWEPDWDSEAPARSTGLSSSMAFTGPILNSNDGRVCEEAPLLPEATLTIDRADI